VRLFVAVELSRRTRDAMADEQKRMAAAIGRAGAPLKWVRVDQAHLTLVFLGEVDEARMPALVGAFGTDIDLAPFEMVFTGIGVFPARGAPRVLWAGIDGGLPELQALHDVVAARVGAQGVPVEAREFHPHLTLARWPAAQPSDRERARAAARPGAIARERVTGATLFESRLSPAGAAHTALARVNLTRT
jgi:RNA 2',3'-cyclic 3'-phosphodiesterase